MPSTRTTLIALIVTALAATACSSEGDGAGGTSTSTPGGDSSTTAPAIERPEGPAAELSEPLTAGGGVALGAATAGVDLAAAGYVESEHAAGGTATSYRSDGELPTDGTFVLEPEAEADYRTRVLVRRPGAAADFNGTVVVEWLNVSGGLDANPDYSFMAEELVRGGYAWVGVSAQHIGIEGGPVAVGVPAAADLLGQGLRAVDPERYGSLHHPGDAFSYDIYTQIARALRADGASGVLGDLEPDRLLAVGESQSGFALTTYANGVQPSTRQFDGFLIHSRGGAAAPLGEPDEGIDIAGTIGGAPTTIRTDLDVPVIMLQSESDVVGILNYLPARQEDTELIRLWEVAGTAHADRYLIGAIADTLECATPINDGPHHYLVRAALRALDTWVRTGEAPAEAPRLTVVDGAYVRDTDGIVEGGIRTPHVDVPVDALSGEAGPGGGVICLLLGSTVPLPDDRLIERYESADAYLADFEAATDAAIDAGFVLPEDRDAMLADAQPDRIPG